MSARIIFNDKTEVIAEQNGNCFILEEEIIFPEDLTNITIISNDEERTIESAIVQPCASVNGKYWFTFVAESKEQQEIRKLKEQNNMLVECLLEISEIIYG